MANGKVESHEGLPKWGEGALLFVLFCRGWQPCKIVVGAGEAWAILPTGPRDRLPVKDSLRGTNEEW